MSEWISAREALGLVTDVGLKEGDLIEWARQGLLHVRAKKGKFSGDPCSDEYGNYSIFPEERPKDKVKRQALEPWPDVPTEIWEDKNVKVHWGAGTCETTVNYYEEYYGDFVREHIKLEGLTFSQLDLETLLNGPPPSEAKPQVPRERWQQQRITAEQAAAIQFIHTDKTKPGKNPLGPMDLYRRYVSWLNEDKGGRLGGPFGRTAFGKWRTRYDAGWRIEDSRKWVHKP